MLRWFARASHLDAADARDMARWDHSGGFSLDGSIRVEGPDRAGLERLLPKERVKRGRYPYSHNCEWNTALLLFNGLNGRSQRRSLILERYGQCNQWFSRPRILHSLRV
ncbi:MAG: hypothetical protein AABM64_13880 [Pseudomonadota bacterium]